MLKQGGKPVGYQGIAHDITKWKQAQQDLQVDIKSLEARLEKRACSLQKTVKMLQREIFEQAKNGNRTLGLLAEQERKIRERTGELEQICRELKQLDVENQVFLFSFSHEILSFLHALHLFSRMLIDSRPVDDKTRDDFLTYLDMESSLMTNLLKKNSPWEVGKT